MALESWATSDGVRRSMRGNRRRDTKPELAVRRGLWEAGIRGWRCHPKTVPGKPDVAFTRWHVAVFIDGRFWHGHPDYFTFGKSGGYWDKKIARTQERDRLANEALVAARWTVLRFWDFEVEEDLAGCLEVGSAALAQRREGREPGSRIP